MLQNNKVIVFGGSGFLGSYVADELLDRGYNVLIYDLVPYTRLKKGQEMVIGDISDEDKVRGVIEDGAIIYNFAAVADIEKASLDPFKTVGVNILGNLNLMNVAKDYDIRRYIFASSIYVYGKSGSFYRASKHATELFIESFNEMYGLNYLILRYGSLYGRYANDSNSIQQMLKSALMTGKIQRCGNGEEIREYIHVKDAAKCSVDILNHDCKTRYLTIAGHYPTKIKDLLTMIAEIMNNNITIEYLLVRKPLHYKITPYSFMPKMAEKISSDRYIDFGQGILDCLNHLHKDIKK